MPERMGKTYGGSTGLDLTALRLFYPLSILVTFVIYLVARDLFSSTLSTGILAGGVFGVLNLGLIIYLVVSVLDPVKQNPLIAFLILAVKVPIVYGLLFMLFAGKLIDLMGFAIGFQVFIVNLLIHAAVAHIVKNRMQIRKGDVTG